MKIRRQLCGALSASFLLLILASCGAPAPPLPPSLELAKPVTDLQVTRKGNQVSLTWTVPSETTDFALVRHPGATRICRGAQPDANRCVIDTTPAQFMTLDPVRNGEQYELWRDPSLPWSQQLAP